MLCEREGKNIRNVGESTTAQANEREVDVNTGEKIHNEQSFILASQRRTDFMALLFFSTAMLLTLWPVTDSQWAVVWFMAVCSAGIFNRLANAVTPSLPILLRATRQLASEKPNWLGSAIAGALWGSVIGHFPSNDTLLLVFLISLHLSYLVIGAALRAPCLPVLHGFIAGAALTSVFMLVLRKDVQVEQYLPFVLLAVFGLIALGHLHNRLLTRQIGLRLDADERAELHENERNQARTEMLQKNQFLAAASHDLRQPVYAIGLLTGILEMQLQQHDTKGVLGKIQCSIASLSSLFDGILDISRLDAKAVENDPQNIRLDPLLMRLQSEYELQALAKGLSLKVNTSSGHIAHVDPTLLQRVLMNLVSNAIKFTDQGSIVVSIEPQGDTLSIKVTDTGCGIASDQREHIFIEYQQIRSDGCDSATGRGLGLAIVKRLCHLMNVQISLRSTPGVGTEFDVSIVNGDPGRLQQEELHYRDGVSAPLSTRACTNVQQASDQMAEVA